MTILVTGASSGLGRYLHECYGGVGVSRESPVAELNITQPLEAIVHCAFSSNRGGSAAQLYRYVDDNLLQTLALTEVPHRKFIYISTVDVYPKDGKVYFENTEIADLEHLDVYSMTKLFAESVVQNRCSDPLILRCGLLLGKYMRNNNLLRLIRGDSQPLTLTRDSGINCVLYSDILEFINLALKAEIGGIFNAVKSDTVSLGELAERYNSNARFGQFRYLPTGASNRKISEICGVFRETSLEAVERFLRENP